MGSADLDDVIKGSGFLIETVAQRIDGGQQSIVAFTRACDMDGGGEAIVGALGVVDVIVGVYRTL